MSIENGYFIEEVIAVKKSSKEKSIRETSTKRLKGAMIDLYEKYILDDSPFQLNLNSSTVKPLHDKIASGEGLCIQDFDNILNIVHLMVYENTFNRYMAASTKKK